MKRTLLSWSSGKDSAWSLHLLRQQNEYEVVGLLTTFNQEANRVAMHAVRRSLVEAQAKAVGIPLWDVDLPWPCSNADYESIMKEKCKDAVHAGIECIAFGDLFLTNIRYTVRSSWRILDCSQFFRCGACLHGSLPVP
jgi:diphthamide synthase (EF-2-diphthine--ammonia ligase)